MQNVVMADEDEARWEERLKNVATQKPPNNTAE